MLKKIFILGILFLLVGQAPQIFAQASEGIKTADALYHKFLETKDLEILKKALYEYKKIADANPSSYEANWKTAMACREYADNSKKQGVPNWKEICKKYGKMGMEYAEKAIKLNPSEIEGHLYYGLCVGSYADAVSVLTALKEGLKGKTRKALEKAYNINKNYQDGLPAFALGRFWEVLPWYAGRDKKKALKYYEEAYKIMPENSRFRPELLYDYGKLLITTKKDKTKGIELLELAANSNDQYFSKMAKKALEKYKK